MNTTLLIEMPDIKIIETGNGTIMISLPESILFSSGEARIRPEALPFLKSLAQILIELDRHVRILGHTDNVPIRTAQFPSNWELSPYVPSWSSEFFPNSTKCRFHTSRLLDSPTPSPSQPTTRLKAERKTVGLKLLFWRRA